MIKRIRLLIQLERVLWASPVLRFRDKLLFCCSRFTTLPIRKYVFWLGDRFYVDGRLSALLLPGYLDEISTVLEATRLKSSFRYVLDVGANLGQFAVAMLHFDRDCILISVEPNETIIPLLRKNLSRFGERWSLIVQAVGPESKVSDFYSVERKSAQGSLVKSNANSNLLRNGSVVLSKVKEGPLTKEMIEQIIGHPIEIFRLVKVDVEGYESNALIGLREMVSSYFWVETIENRERGMSSAEVELLLTSIFGRVSMSKSYGSNSLFEIETVT